ncbi:hypothetical protein U27_00455 [Candidatus Vecturithrix granuli]|uniref:Phosphoribulokinase/uridine kinase domain-containing protein n=1 Tax=Vecturithrix granuli TaxID=1499967 RepID=A0A081C7K3_VECG1|nr:hypothetical protein U27_00455 [Candidatus Vecturithrix granuli]
MQGDKFVVAEQHLEVAKKMLEILQPRLTGSQGKYTITIAGESGSGKSTTAAALFTILQQQGLSCVLLQQDDYYIYPPITNDHTRRQNPEWRGLCEVNLTLLDQHLQEFLEGCSQIQKPLIVYAEDRIDHEIIDVEQANILIVEGTFISLLKHVNARIFIDRTYLDTRIDRRKRSRYQAELDNFTEGILAHEHEIVSAHKAFADIIITQNYEVLTPPPAPPQRRGGTADRYGEKQT